MIDASIEERPVPADVVRVDPRPCDASVCVVAIAAEHLHTCAAIYGEAPRCWGANDHGQLGVPDASPDANGVPLTVAMPEVDRIGAGGFVGDYRSFTCASSKDGRVWCWGDDSLGQRASDAGSDAAAARAVPTMVPGVGGVVSLGVGGAHVCTGLDDGGVTCWGFAAYGQLGHPAPSGSNVDQVPSPVVLPRPALAVAAGGLHSCALLDDRTVDCFGLNNLQQLGRSDPASSAPEVVPDVASVAQVVASYAHTCAVLDDGTMRCWGYNGGGQLGQGTATVAEKPAPVLLPPGRRATAACAGFLHSCALLDDGTVACWGQNARGQVGTGVVLPNNTTDPATVLAPKIVDGVRDVRALSCGGQHTCTLHTNGTVTCWGANERGQLGRATSDALPHPEPGAVLF